jgi:uncharacterized protein with HEPN domain
MQDMLDSARRARSFTIGMDANTFAADEKTIYATVRAIEVLGEAAKHVPPAIREQEPDIPWRDIAGMRDLVIHAYHRVDVAVVWRTVHEVLPWVEPRVEAALERQRRREGADDADTSE